MDFELRPIVRGSARVVRVDAQLLGVNQDLTGYTVEIKASTSLGGAETTWVSGVAGGQSIDLTIPAAQTGAAGRYLLTVWATRAGFPGPFAARGAVEVV